MGRRHDQSGEGGDEKGCYDALHTFFFFYSLQVLTFALCLLLVAVVSAVVLLVAGPRQGHALLVGASELVRGAGFAWEKKKCASGTATLVLSGRDATTISQGQITIALHEQLVYDDEEQGPKCNSESRKKSGS